MNEISTPGSIVERDCIRLMRTHLYEIDSRVSWKSTLVENEAWTEAAEQQFEKWQRKVLAILARLKFEFFLQGVDFNRLAAEVFASIGGFRKTAPSLVEGFDELLQTDPTQIGKQYSAKTR